MNNRQAAPQPPAGTFSLAKRGEGNVGHTLVSPRTPHRCVDGLRFPATYIGTSCRSAHPPPRLRGEGYGEGLTSRAASL